MIHPRVKNGPAGELHEILQQGAPRVTVSRTSLFSEGMSHSKSERGCIVVLGYGTGVSRSVARRFGRAGFNVAIVARSKEKLDDAVRTLEAEGIRAAAYQADVGDEVALVRLVQDASTLLGPIAIIHHNANSFPSGDLAHTITADALNQMHSICVTSLIVAVQAALPSLKGLPKGTASVLVTNGAAGLRSQAAGTPWSGGALCNAGKSQAARVLAPQLAADGVFLGEVVINGGVSSLDVDPDDVASTFWRLHTQRDTPSLIIRRGSEVEPTDSYDCRRLHEHSTKQGAPPSSTRRVALVDTHFVHFGLALLLAVAALIAAGIAVRRRMARGGGGASALGARMLLRAKRSGPPSRAEPSVRAIM